MWQQSWIIIILLFHDSTSRRNAIWCCKVQNTRDLSATSGICCISFHKYPICIIFDKLFLQWIYVISTNTEPIEASFEGFMLTATRLSKAFLSTRTHLHLWQSEYNRNTKNLHIVVYFLLFFSPTFLLWPLRLLYIVLWNSAAVMTQELLYVWFCESYL